MSSSTAFDGAPRSRRFRCLTDLALDLRWSFNHSADQLWKQLDPELWELTHNPWVLLQTVSREKLRAVSSDPGFQKLLADHSPRENACRRVGCVVSEGASALGPVDNRVFLHGIYVERSPADLFRRPRQCCWRSAQAGEQPGRPRDWRGFALSARLFPAGN